MNPKFLMDRKKKQKPWTRLWFEFTKTGYSAPGTVETLTIAHGSELSAIYAELEDTAKGGGCQAICLDFIMG